MTEITRAVTEADLADTLRRSIVATVAWNDGGDVAAVPAAFRFDDHSYAVGVPPGTVSAGTVANVLVDEGARYFELRGVRVRGRLESAESRGNSPLEWFVVRVERLVAWDYGSMRTR